MSLTNECWLEASITSGRLKYFSDKSAFIVYNNEDEIKQRIEFVIIELAMFLSITKHLGLSIRFQQMNREIEYLMFSGPFASEKETQGYIDRTIIGGIQWRI